MHRAASIVLIVSLSGCSCSRAPRELASTDAAPVIRPLSSARLDAGAAGASSSEGKPRLFPLGPLPADAPFEGRVTVVVESMTDVDEGSTSSATYHFTTKGHKARWDLFGSGGKGSAVGYRIYDGDQHRFFTVMKQPVLYATNEALLPGAVATKPTWTFAPAKDEPHGSVQNIPCDRVETKDDKYQYSACLTSKLTTIPIQLLGPAAAIALPFGNALEKQGLFPLTVVARGPVLDPRSKGRPVVAKLTVEEVERGSVPDDVFTLPSYPVTETPTLIAPGLHR
jgi:hypothetical protein